MKIIAFDLGDVHTGIARADELGFCAAPYTTVDTKNLISWIEQAITDNLFDTVVIGLPKTLKGTDSQQTIKVIEYKENLEKRFPTIIWILWDERLTSKQARALKPQKIKRDKGKEHAIAAALILQGYLESVHYKQNSTIDNVS
jgi:putative holliday junction resolvase